mgnify:CR=1 FL=1
MNISEGKWEIVFDQFSNISAAISHNGREIFRFSPSTKFFRAEKLAYAKFISAAPDLYEACKEAKKLLDKMLIPMGIQKTDTASGRIYAQVKAAIAKAEK